MTAKGDMNGLTEKSGKFSLDNSLSEQNAPATAKELAHATQLLKMKEAEVDNYKRNNERLERELYQTKFTYDLVKNNAVWH